MTATHQSVIDAFTAKLSEFGIQLSEPGSIKLDGAWHRAHVDGDRRGQKNLSYRIHFDDRPAGFFEDHKRGVSGTFSVSNGQDMDPAARAAAQREWRKRQAEREAEQERAYEQAASQAADELRAATASPASHPYVTRKGIVPGAAIRATAEGQLLVPVYQDFGKVCSLQRIAGDGDKLFMTGGRMAGAFHPINGTDKRRVLVCEGYATGAALAAATGHSVACSMSAGNLPAIVAKMQAKFPDREVVAMVDNDHGTEARTGRNPGIEAGKSSGVRWLAPDFEPGDPGTDWDDWLRGGRSVADLLALLDDDQGPEPGPGQSPEPSPDPRPEPAPDRAPVADVDLPAAPSTGELLQRTLDDWRHELTEVADADSDDLPAQYSEDNVALAFSRRFADDLRYVSAWGRWMRWSGQRWVHDDSLMAFDLSRKVCRSVAAAVRTDAELTPKQQDAIASRYGQANTVAAIERLAKADRRHAATTDQWDADLWLLNTPAGVVDLRTATIRGPKRDDHMTKITACAPGGECPTWLRFLHVATAGDVDLQRFLQRVAGYALTGSTRDHAMFFVYGPGGNGKGTFLNTVTRIMGDYAKVAGMEVFTETRGERHPTELASLRGARMVSAQETEEGKRWNESRIKALTGGDPITARFMRMDEFTFIPQFKLVIAGNHKPGLRNVDEAMKRRMHLIPFEVTLDPKDRDTRLPEKLAAESGGILSWMIEGCRDWADNGLQPPGRVLAATSEYLDQQDVLAAWIEECCELGQGKTCRRSNLYKSFKAWAERSGEYALPQKRFVAAIEARGFVCKTRDGYPMVDGIKPGLGAGENWQ